MIKLFYWIFQNTPQSTGERERTQHRDEVETHFTERRKFLINILSLWPSWLSLRIGSKDPKKKNNLLSLGLAKLFNSLKNKSPFTICGWWWKSSIFEEVWVEWIFFSFLSLFLPCTKKNHNEIDFILHTYEWCILQHWINQTNES